MIAADDNGAVFEFEVESRIEASSPPVPLWNDDATNVPIAVMMAVNPLGPVVDQPPSTSAGNEATGNGDEEFQLMFHATSSAAASAIVQSQTFRRSGSGSVGPGVYLSKDRAQAEGYRKPLGTGSVLKCRVKLGVCIQLRDQDGRTDPLMKTWHSHCLPCRGCSLPGGRCVETGPRYNSAWAPAGITGTASRDKEENCVYNPERISHIEIIDGPGTGTGPEFWPKQSLKWQPTCADRILQIGRVTGFVWVWKDDWKWRPYSQREAAQIEEAHQAGQVVDFNVSSIHSVNLARMVQMRRDDPSRTRLIQRRVEPRWSVPTNTYGADRSMVAICDARIRCAASPRSAKVGWLGLGQACTVNIVQEC